MKTTMSILLLRLLLFTAFVSAWSWAPLAENIGLAPEKRQVSSSTGGSSSSISPSSGATVSSTPASTGLSSSGTITSDSSAAASSDASAAASSGSSASGSSGSSASGSGTITSGSKTTTSKSSAKTTGSTSFDPRLPAGGISMLNPPATTTTYYKIGDYVTFKWNYTSLSVTPTAIDVMASCSANAELYTIALNQSVEATGAVTWDTNNYQSTATAPLVMATYTLIIYDAESSISATARAGYLGVADTFTFGMYLPQQYQPLNEFKCATCNNGAMSDMHRQALGFVFGMATVTLLSFTWFVGGVGAFF